MHLVWRGDGQSSACFPVGAVVHCHMQKSEPCKLQYFHRKQWTIWWMMTSFQVHTKAVSVVVMTRKAYWKGDANAVVMYMD